MKKILLASVALTAFAGAAAAEVSFSGSATLGYNDDNGRLANNATFGDHNGFYSDLNLDVAFSATLDNGITVSASADVDEVDAAEGAAAGVTLTISSDTASLVYGDTTFAAEAAWAAVGSMDSDGFSEQDGEDVIKASLTFGDVTVTASQEINDGHTASGVANTGADYTDTGAMSASLVAALGDVNVTVAYQERETATDLVAQDEILAFRAGTTVAGADVAFGYADNQTDDTQSTGISVVYPTGDLTIAASYVLEDVATGTTEDNWDIKVSYAAGAMTASVKTDEADDWAVEGTYDLGNGLVIAAGAADAGDDVYLGGTYDLGGGASLLVSYADDSDNDEAAGDDDIGAQGYAVGTTVALSFAF